MQLVTLLCIFAGILTAICECEADEAEFCEQVIKGRSQTGGNAVVILHNLIDHGGDLTVVHAARVLRLVAEDPSVRTPSFLSSQGLLSRALINEVKFTNH